MIDDTVSKIIELLYDLGFKELFKSSDPSMRFSKQLMGFSVKLKNHSHKNLGLAVIIDIKFVPTVRKNGIKEEIENALQENKTNKTESQHDSNYTDDNGRIK